MEGKGRFVQPVAASGRPVFIGRDPEGQIELGRQSFLSPNEALVGHTDYDDNAVIVDRSRDDIIDAAGMMPSGGSGAFWQGIIEWVGGRDVGQVLRTIDERWPAENRG